MDVSEISPYTYTTGRRLRRIGVTRAEISMEDIWTDPDELLYSPKHTTPTKCQNEAHRTIVGDGDMRDNMLLTLGFIPAIYRLIG